MGINDVAAKPYWREADARVLLGAWRASGLTLAGFAEEYRCSSRRLGRWATRLGLWVPASRAQETTDSRSAVRTARSAGHELRFVELVGHRPTPAIEVALGRAVVRVPAGFDPATLQQIVAVLEASC